MQGLACLNKIYYLQSSARSDFPLLVSFSNCLNCVPHCPRQHLNNHYTPLSSESASKTLIETIINIPLHNEKCPHLSCSGIFTGRYIQHTIVKETGGRLVEIPDLH